jgi:hypothetical protein
MALEQLAPFGALPGVSLISLQKGEAARETASAPPGMAIQDWTDEINDFADTAALIHGLDLVISVDTAVTRLSCISLARSASRYGCSTASTAVGSGCTDLVVRLGIRRFGSFARRCAAIGRVWSRA